ncbi:MAG: hypothetical protein M3077_14455 [Candidatus Dormibacteraeota bacterium]|nr:hypothetical protein [Candidatus Dormibacteraeota bacterium]
MASSQSEERAAEAEVDPNRLLEGEDPDSADVDDARHWATVYQELRHFKRRMIETAESAIADGIQKPASREIVSTDLVALRAELRRFEHRLAFWTRRTETSRQ